MIIEDLSTLKIHKLTQEQYDRELAAGRIDAAALYLTPDEEYDLSKFVTTEQLDAYTKTSELGALATKDRLTASDVGALPDTTEIPSIEGLASESYVIEQIQNIPIDDIISGIEDSINDALTEAKAYSDKKGGYTEPETKIVWDGDTAGLFAIPYEGVIGYKVSDDVIDLSKVTRLVDSEGQEIDLENYRVLTEGIVQALAAPELYVAVIPEDTDIQGFPVPKGTYFVENIRSIEAGEIIHTIKPKFLPEGGFGYTEDKLVVVGLHTCYLVEEVERYEPVPYILYYTPSYKYNFTVDRSLLINGKEVNVIWDGSLFTCKIHILDDGDEMVIGNGSLDGSGHDTGEPFSISIFPAHGSISVCSKDRGGEHTFEIFFGYGAVHKIDPKYLPDGGFGYTESAKIINIFNEQTCTFTDYFSEGYVNYMKFELIDDFSLIRDSDKVDVIWDGEKYSCSFYRGDGGELVGGTAGAMYYGQFSFAISEDYAELWSRTEGEHTFSMSVSLKDEVVHKIDTKYLPEGSVGYTEDAYEIYWNGDTDGKLMYLDMFVQVSEDTVDFSQVEDCLGMTDAGEISILDPNFGSGTLETLNIDEYTNAIMLSGQPVVVTTTKDHYLSQYMIEIKKGTYFAYTNSSSYICSLKIKEVVHTIDPKYIPEDDSLKLPDVSSATATMILQNDGEEVYWIPEGGVRAKGNPVTFSSKANLNVNVITKLTSELTDDTLNIANNRLQLSQITGSNALDLFCGERKDTNTGELYGIGTVIERNGLRGVLNADGTITISGTCSTTFNIIDTKWNSWETLNNYVILPAGTYTIHSRTMLNLTSLDNYEFLQVRGPFSISKPYLLKQYIHICYAGTTYNETIPLGIFLGTSVPADTAYRGTDYVVKFSDKLPLGGSFNWATGELVDKDGTIIETVSPTAIMSMEGSNTLYSAYGVNTISYQANRTDVLPEINSDTNGMVLTNDGVSAYWSTANLNGGSSKFNYEEYPLPVLYLEGSTLGIGKDTKVNLNYRFKTHSGTCTCKWQGSSSINYEKKNYTIVVDTPFEAVEGWGVQSKYCIKANYIDFSHVRNICAAKLWGEARKVAVNDVFKDLVNAGAIDGFPIALVINNEYMGLYSFNIPKDPWMFGYSGEVATEAIIGAEIGSDATKFKATPLIDGTDFEFEHIAKNADEAALKASFVNVYNKVANYSAMDMYNSELSQVLDMDRLLDYYIFVTMFDAYDCYKKNYLMTTKDGIKWHIGAYDLDTIWGNHWQGSSYYKPTWRNFSWYASESELFNIIYTNHKSELKARYNLRRADKWSEDNLFITLYNYAVQIPKIYFDEDMKLWKNLPGTYTNNLSEILSFYSMKLKVLDNEVSTWS